MDLGWGQSMDTYRSSNCFLSSAELRSRAEEMMNRRSTWPANDRGQMTRLFNEVYAELEPTQNDRDSRSAVVQFLNSVIGSKMPGSTIVPFGSFQMNMFTLDSDLDLSLEVNCGRLLTRQEKVFCLKKLKTCLYQLRGRFFKIQPIYRATVPIVKFSDHNTGVVCDVSVENRDGVSKSSLLAMFSTIDPRFRHLCFLLKQWAKVNRINNPSTGTLSSYALILLVAVHLQTRSPPILPAFSFVLEGLELGDISRSIYEVRRRAESFHGYGSRNLETVAQLFENFFLWMVSVRELWHQGLCASAYHGQYISKVWENNRIACISVEDFTDPSQNAARAVTVREFETIYQCVTSTLDLFRQPITDMLSFKDALFGGGGRNPAQDQRIPATWTNYPQGEFIPPRPVQNLHYAQPWEQQQVQQYGQFSQPQGPRYGWR